MGYENRKDLDKKVQKEIKRIEKDVFEKDCLIRYMRLYFCLMVRETFKGRNNKAIRCYFLDSEKQIWL